MDEIINAGYRIIERRIVNEQGVVLGEHLVNPDHYVTWQFRVDSDRDFYWGHYITGREAAYADFDKRIVKLTSGE